MPTNSLNVKPVVKNYIVKEKGVYCFLRKGLLAVFPFHSLKSGAPHTAGDFE